MSVYSHCWHRCTRLVSPPGSKGYRGGEDENAVWVQDFYHLVVHFQTGFACQALLAVTIVSSSCGRGQLYLSGIPDQRCSQLWASGFQMESQISTHHGRNQHSVSSSQPMWNLIETAQPTDDVDCYYPVWPRRRRMTFSADWPRLRSDCRNWVRVILRPGAWR